MPTDTSQEQCIFVQCRLAGSVTVRIPCRDKRRRNAIETISRMTTNNLLSSGDNFQNLLENIQLFCARTFVEWKSQTFAVHIYEKTWSRVSISFASFLAQVPINPINNNNVDNDMLAEHLINATARRHHPAKIFKRCVGMRAQASTFNFDVCQRHFCFCFFVFFFSKCYFSRCGESILISIKTGCDIVVYRLLYLSHTKRRPTAGSGTFRDVCASCIVYESRIRLVTGFSFYLFFVAFVVWRLTVSFVALTVCYHLFISIFIFGEFVSDR